MDLLKISNGDGYFINEKGEYVKIDEIQKEDILYLLEAIMDNDNIIIDESQEKGDKKINSPAQKIIYDNIAKKFLDVIQKKPQIIEQVEAEFKDAKLRYSKLLKD